MRDDTAKAVKEFGVKTMFNKKGIEQIEKRVLPGETVLAILNCNFEISYQDKRKSDSHPGFFLLTTEAIYLDCSVSFSNTTERIPLENITSVNTSFKPLGSYIKFDIISKTYSLLVSDKEAQKVYPCIQQAISQLKQRRYAQPVKEPVIETDIFAKIEKLADLRDRGILTEEEFQQKKKEWLKSI